MNFGAPQGLPTPPKAELNRPFSDAAGYVGGTRSSTAADFKDAESYSDYLKGLGCPPRKSPRMGAVGGDRLFGGGDTGRRHLSERLHGEPGRLLLSSLLDDQ
jgi:hypothetical protein